MYKRVDNGAEDQIVQGFSYSNKVGVIEYVEMHDWKESNAHVGINDGDEESCYIFKEDIPKLILALQAAYDFKGN